MTSTEIRASESYWQSDVPGKIAVPVARPRLPTADEIAPYLHRIDKTQWYSNGGPLVQEFEARLGTHMDQETACVATVANATIGLALSLLAHDVPPGTLCMVPAWTFAATAHAIQLAGLVPWIVDINPTSWALEASTARELLRNAPDTVSAVIPVSPFGAPINAASWQNFREATGVAVVIDAAAAFDTIRTVPVPAVVSLHATKVLGLGEGGFVVAPDASFIEEVQKRANFGFWGSRESTVRSFNGKMSEYAAAVGLAALDAWAETRADFARVARTYREAFAREPGIAMQDGFGESWIASTVMVAAEKPGAEAIASALAANQIGSRRWWGGGLHRHAAFEQFPRHQTNHSDKLADIVIGLPCWRDLPNEDITRVCEVILSACD